MSLKRCIEITDSYDSDFCQAASPFPKTKKRKLSDKRIVIDVTVWSENELPEPQSPNLISLEEIEDIIKIKKKKERSEKRIRKEERKTKKQKTVIDVDKYDDLKYYSDYIIQGDRTAFMPYIPEYLCTQPHVDVIKGFYGSFGIKRRNKDGINKHKTLHSLSEIINPVFKYIKPVNKHIVSPYFHPGHRFHEDSCGFWPVFLDKKRYLIEKDDSLKNDGTIYYLVFDLCLKTNTYQVAEFNENGGWEIKDTQCKNLIELIFNNKFDSEWIRISPFYIGDSYPKPNYWLPRLKMLNYIFSISRFWKLFSLYHYGHLIFDILHEVCLEYSVLQPPSPFKTEEMRSKINKVRNISCILSNEGNKKRLKRFLTKKHDVGYEYEKFMECLYRITRGICFIAANIPTKEELKLEVYGSSSSLTNVVLEEINPTDLPIPDIHNLRVYNPVFHMTQPIYGMRRLFCFTPFKRYEKTNDSYERVLRIIQIADKGGKNVLDSAIEAWENPFFLCDGKK